MEKKTRARFQETTLTQPRETTHNWLILDAKGKTLGRFASEVAKILRGKHKVKYNPNTDCGDGVIVINADKVVVSGNKEAQKTYRSYTGWIGGFRELPFRTMLEKKPEQIIVHAVEGMIPRTRLGRKQCKRLRVFAGDQKHTQVAQQPQQISI